MSINDFVARLDRLDMPWWVARTISWFLTLNAFTTSWDYLHTPEVAPTARSLTMVEQIATLHTWGIWYGLAGGVLTLGLLFTRHAVVWLGHFLLSLLYAGFAVATFQAVLEYAGSPQEEAGGPIWRAASWSLLLFVLHSLLCWTRGPIPRRGGGR